MSSPDETDPCKEKYCAEDKIDKYFFYILHPASRLHKIDCAKDQPGYSKEGKHNTNDSFFHRRFFLKGDAKVVPIEAAGCWGLAAVTQIR